MDNTISTALGVVAASTVLGYSIRSCFKINKIEIWTPPASQGTAATCKVLWPASQRSMDREVTDTTNSVTLPAHVVCGPPRESLSAFWTPGTSGLLMFTLTAPPGSIIDLWVSMVDNDADPTNTATLVGATAGRTYYTSLDSSTSAGSIYTPIGLTTA